MKIALAAATLFVSSFLSAQDAPAPVVAPAVSTAHAEAITAIRDLIPIYEKALVSGDIAALKPLFTADCEIVTLSGTELKGFDALSTWWSKVRSYMGENGKMSVKLVPETPSIFLSETCILARGRSDEVMTVKGKDLSYTEYWTAILQKQADGSWKVSRLHSSVDAIDNPFAKAKSRGTIITCALGSLVLGLIFGFLLGRRRKQV